MSENKKKGFFGEFKEFISRGNIMDMAVGVIVGSAFTAIVTSLTNNILKPLINWILCLILGTNSLSGVYTYLTTVYTQDELGNQVIDLTQSIYIDWGEFINAIINFVLIAFVLFCIVKAFNALRRNSEKVKNAIVTKKAKKEEVSETTSEE